MVFEYAACGAPDGMEPTVITEIARYYEKEIGYKIPPMTPLVGSDFNLTRSGIHADGLLKDEEIYTIFNTEKILKLRPRVSINQHSGLAGLAHWVNSYFNIPQDERIDKRIRAHR